MFFHHNQSFYFCVDHIIINKRRHNQPREVNETIRVCNGTFPLNNTREEIIQFHDRQLYFQREIYREHNWYNKIV